VLVSGRAGTAVGVAGPLAGRDATHAVASRTTTAASEIRAGRDITPSESREAHVSLKVPPGVAGTPYLEIEIDREAIGRYALAPA
jgi:hypothetical protein